MCVCECECGLRDVCECECECECGLRDVWIKSECVIKGVY